ncbi:MAG: hypothetical protein EOM10_09375 [Opitutae bacterium]|nr:hypothetical protein [Opitutae bacterium]
MSEKRFFIGSDFRALFPSSRIGVVVACDIDNGGVSEGKARLERAGAEALGKNGRAQVERDHAREPVLDRFADLYAQVGARTV